MTLYVFLLAVGSISLNACAQIALRKTMLAVGGLPGSLEGVLAFAFAILTNSWFILGMTCYAVSISAWLIVLSKTEVSAAYPLLSIGYVITAIVGALFLGEHVTLARIAGIGLICGGLTLIAQSA
jgi:multidrug transporter EmrE-like cation transporter